MLDWSLNLLRATNACVRATVLGPSIWSQICWLRWEKEECMRGFARSITYKNYYEDMRAILNCANDYVYCNYGACDFRV